MEGESNSLRSITRLGNMGRIFGGGDSQLLNCIARLSVLYEDFRVEHTALGEIAALSDKERPLHWYRFMYQIRRSVATMNEYQGGLTQVLRTNEFKQARLSDIDSAYIAEANRYLQHACGRIKEWRNAIGGHFQYSAAETACRNIPDRAIGSVTWNSGADAALGLHLQYAEHFIAGAINGLVTAVDSLEELGLALNEIMGGYVHVQKATYALVHHFLWPKFG